MTVSCYRAGVATQTLIREGAESTPRRGPIVASWLGRIGYTEAHALQKRLVAERADGTIEDQLLLLEHPAVLTLGRNSDPSHVLADAPTLEARGISVERVERGGEVTYHGPGQLVAYPIIRLADRGLLIRPFVRALEAALVETCAALGVAAGRREGHPGCWCDPDGVEPRKIGALGLRVERGVTLSRHRPQRDRRSSRLRADRSVRDARRRVDLDRTRARRRCLAIDRSPSNARRTSSPWRSPPPSTPRSKACEPVAAGLFELRKDPITGWWVATVVDRAFHRDRFARAAGVDRRPDVGLCQLHDTRGRRRPGKDAQGLRLPRGRNGRRREGTGPGDRSAPASARRVRREAGEPSSRRPASTDRFMPSAATSSRDSSVGRGMPVADARSTAQTDYLQVVQNWGAQAGARTNHLCLDLYDLPQVPHRVAEEMGGAARFVIREGECPFCRLVREESVRPDRLVWEDHGSVAFAPYASRSPFEVWIVPRRHEADFGRAGAADIVATSEALRQVLGKLGASLDGPPYNLVLHTAPLREQVDATYHWHWEIHPRLREIAGLELGTGLPVNPVSPEDAVEELLGRAEAALDGTG